LSFYFLKTGVKTTLFGGALVFRSWFLRNLEDPNRAIYDDVVFLVNLKPFGKIVCHNDSGSLVHLMDM
jgi:hypothetical protein